MWRIDKIVRKQNGTDIQVPFVLLSSAKDSNYVLHLIDSDTDKLVKLACSSLDFSMSLYGYNPYGYTSYAFIAVDKQAFDLLACIDEVEYYRSENEHNAVISYPVPIEQACTLWRYGDGYSTLLDMFAGSRFAQGSGWNGDRFHALGQGHDVFCIKFNNMSRATDMVVQRSRQLK